MNRLLIANRGEIAIRIARAAAELKIPAVAIFAEDDQASLHVHSADAAVALQGSGAKAYLDIDQVVRLAVEHACDAVHPGYGFLSENAGFARACEAAGITFVGPAAAALDLFGDKGTARDLAERSGVPVLRASKPDSTADDVAAFFESLDGRPIVIKAIGGGGGRGMRVVESSDAIADAHRRCQSEARAAFGNGAVYAEELVARARHIEVQVIADAHGAVSHLGERDCSIQRRHQKIVEIAPAPSLPQSLREAIWKAAMDLAIAGNYRGAGTFEFLVDATDLDAGRFAFIEANPRLQVEHTVTEEITGVDIVQAQLRIADGATLASLGLDAPRTTFRGFAIQARVNMETMSADGQARPSSGTLTEFQPPTGPGLRTDTFGYAGYKTSARYDSLLAKVIAHTDGDFPRTLAKASRALGEFRIAGLQTNIPFLRAILAAPEIVAAEMYTRYIDDHAATLVEAAAAYVPAEAPATDSARETSTPGQHRLAGVRVDASDPLAVLTYGQQESVSRRSSSTAADEKPPEGMVALRSPLQGTVVSIAAAAGDTVRAGQVLAVMESMKMEHEIRADTGGVVRDVSVEAGDTIVEGITLLLIEPLEGADTEAVVEEEVDLDEIRPDLKEVVDRRATTLDANRPNAVARRRQKKQRTARENVEQLVDPGTFVEYGQLVLAAQRRRRSLEELIEKSPTDGMITGVGSVNGHLFPDPINRCAVMAYDYTVFAGTQGNQNHRKTDRMIDIAEKGRMPMILFAEGGGGRPGDTDGIGVSSQRTFSRFAQLSGLVPMVGITSGRCFAGNASLLGCCDVIIATADSNIGMGGPAMIEGGGLGVYAPEDIGGMDIQVPNGVVDLAVEDEHEAVEVAKRYLSYFQGPIPAWEAPDQRRMRRIVPENRLRVYNVRDVIETLADRDSVLELRPNFGVGMLTSLIRIEGRPVGVIANNPVHLGGAIDSDGSDKGARFMQLCDAFDIPLLYLCDTPGIMVGPDIERTALVRHSSRMFLVGANLTTPFFTIILRKAYGLGAIAMAGGNYKVPMFTVSWPTGEFGGMGLEGSVKLGYREDLARIEDPTERLAKYEEMVARAYEGGKALNQASMFHFDDTIDPADSRYWLASLLKSLRTEPRTAKKRANIDAW